MKTKIKEERINKGLCDCVADEVNKKIEQIRNRLTKEFGERRRMTSTLWKQVIRRYPACLKCGSTENLAVDHITPLFSFGKTEWGNLQTLCGRCNRQKGVTTADYRR